MRQISALAGLSLLALATPHGAQDAPAAATLIYSNEEQAYFAREAGRDSPGLVYLKVDGTPISNKPSIALYVHKPDKPDSAESYVWADPGAARIGINLRWMQVRCGINGMEQPSAVTAAGFRG